MADESRHGPGHPQVHELLVLVASENAVEQAWLVAALKPLCKPVELPSGILLERLVLGGLTPDLVVASAKLHQRSGLHVLAAARASGLRTPFIVIFDHRPPCVRALVSEGLETEGHARLFTAPELLDEVKRVLGRSTL